MKFDFRKASIARYILFLPLLFSIFQNCSSDVQFNTDEVLALVNDQDTPIICDPIVSGGSITSCDELTNGFIGEIFYFLNKSTSPDIPSVVYDINDNALSFPDAIVSVEQFFQSGFKLPARLYLSKIETPTIKFSNGFQDSTGATLKDESGQTLIEGFAFKLSSYLKLPESLESGDYEFALLSDDGSILEMDTNGDLSFETIVSNDNLHSTRLGCSSTSVSLQSNKLIPVRMKYYQGPRAHIAFTLLARRLGPGQLPGQDVDCGYTSSSAFYGSDPNQNPNYVPDLVNSKFGALISRGWFVPQTEMFVLPK